MCTPRNLKLRNEIQIFVNAKHLADDDEFEYYFLVALMNGAILSAV